jgi:hypothetical protein
MMGMLPGFNSDMLPQGNDKASQVGCGCSGQDPELGITAGGDHGFDEERSDELGQLGSPAGLAQQLGPARHCWPLSPCIALITARQHGC